VLYTLQNLRPIFTRVAAAHRTRLSFPCWMSAAGRSRARFDQMKMAASAGDYPGRRAGRRQPSAPDMPLASIPARWLRPHRRCAASTSAGRRPALALLARDCGKTQARFRRRLEAPPGVREAIETHERDYYVATSDGQPTRSTTRSIASCRRSKRNIHRSSHPIRRRNGSARAGVGLCAGRHAGPDAVDPPRTNTTPEAAAQFDARIRRDLDLAGEARRSNISPS